MEGAATRICREAGRGDLDVGLARPRLEALFGGQLAVDGEGVALGPHRLVSHLQQLKEGTEVDG